jgi:hypothetical protein
MGVMDGGGKGLDWTRRLVLVYEFGAYNSLGLKVNS